MFRNYGDVDFFENGFLVDEDHAETGYQILWCRPFDDEDDLYFFADCFVDLTDDWIDREAVENFCGYSVYDNDIRFAGACIDFYGPESFSAPYDGFAFSKDEIKQKLRRYFIASDNLNIEW